MHASVRIALAALTALSCRSERPQPDSINVPARGTRATAFGCLGPLFDGRGVGALRIGLSADSIGRLCLVVRDTTELREEGLPVRVVSIAAGSDTLEAEIDGGRVWRIALTHARFRTADSLGVGVPLTRLLSLPAVRGMTGEGALYVVSPSQCGLSFRVTDPAYDAARAEWTVAALRRLPASSVVTEVLIVGCKVVAMPPAPSSRSMR